MTCQLGARTCPSMVKSLVPGPALGCHSFGQSFLCMGRVGESRADGVS